MKKYLTPIIILAIVGAGVFIRYLILSPARALALDLAAINGITVGKTTEAELLGRSAFQTLDRRCFGADCDYHVERENSFLSQLHLAPHIFVGTSVGVRDGMVTRVSILMTSPGLTPMVISQKEKLPPDCASNPCMKRVVLPTKVTMNIMVQFNNESDFRNRMPQMVDVSCLSRLHGCNTYAELMPLAKELNLEAAAH